MQAFRFVMAAVAAASILVCSSAWAKPDDAPPTVDVNVVNDPLNPVPVSLSESFDEHVVLRFRFDSADVCSTFTGQGVGHLELPDRSVEDEPFVVPAGQILVISHLSWQAFTSAGGFTPGEYVSVTLGTRFGNLLITGTVITNEIASANYASGNENINGGMIFREGEAVCIAGGFRVGAVTTSGPSLNGTVLSGRLVDQ